MELQQLIQSLTPEIYQALRSGVELGRWADGRKVTPEQREHAIQAIIYYEHNNNVATEQRVGHMEKQGKPTYGELREQKQHLGVELKL